MINEAEARQLLGVPEGISPRALKAAYRKALKTWHPDLHDAESSSYADAIERTQRINAAYEALGGRFPLSPDVPEVSPLADWYGKPVQVVSRNEALLVWGGLIFLVLAAVVTSLI